jgi:hypothetical protein
MNIDITRHHNCVPPSPSSPACASQNVQVSCSCTPPSAHEHEHGPTTHQERASTQPQQARQCSNECADAGVHQCGPGRPVDLPIVSNTQALTPAHTPQHMAPNSSPHKAHGRDGHLRDHPVLQQTRHSRWHSSRWGNVSTQASQ